MPEFLLEIGCEEIPARMIDGAAADLAARVGSLIGRESLGDATQVKAFSSPRRLAVQASVTASQNDVTEQVTGPSSSVAFKDGQPTGAAQAFARKNGIDVSQLVRVETPKGEYLAATVIKKGRTSDQVLAELLPKEINSIYWPKNMYWRKRGELFVRPVRWLVAMLDDQVIPLEFDGVIAGNESRGHRLLAAHNVCIPRAGLAYIEALREAKVLDRTERVDQIRKSLDAATRTIPGARWREDAALLDAVTNLTEFPTAILGNFDPEFLDLPEEVLVTVMRDHQKYFALEDAQGKLLSHFLAVLNTDGDPDGVIRHGHERVLRARFNDARFFWQADQKISMLDRVPLLKKVTFQKDLGSYYEKSIRVQRLCSWLSEIVKQDGIAIRPGVVHKAAIMAKADLTTELVKEFTELQGIVGGLYTRAQDIDSHVPEATRFTIADAIYDHYKPESVEDSAPRSVESAVLSIADKADSIVGMFALGLIPSGSKDPFALRRQANGIVKTIAAHKLPFRLSELMRDARCGYRGSEAEKKFSADDASEALRAFFRERVEFYLKDVEGYSYDVVNAVLVVDADDVRDILPRAAALKSVSHMPEFQSIGAACKRIRNILRQANEKDIKPAERFKSLPDSAPEEKQLAAFMETTLLKVESLREARNYREALLLIANAREPVDAFFDNVMVMVPHEAVRANRLALLQSLLRQFSTIADFSEIVAESKPSA